MKDEAEPDRLYARAMMMKGLRALCALAGCKNGGNERTEERRYKNNSLRNGNKKKPDELKNRKRHTRNGNLPMTFPPLYGEISRL